MDKVIEKLTMEALPPPPAPVAAQADEALAQEMAAALQSDSDAELAAKVQEQLKVEALSGGVGKGGLCKGPANFTSSSSMFKRDVKYCGQCGYGTTKPDRASCKKCASTKWLTTLDKAMIEGANASNASLKRMIENRMRGVTVQELAKVLEFDADVNLKVGKYGNTALMHASRDGHKDLAEQLIMAHADVNAKNVFGHTALMEASRFGHKDLAEHLIRARADVNAKDEDGYRALIFASNKGLKDLAEKLIKARADVNANNKDGWTALMHASLNGHKDLAEYLIRERADVNAKNGEGRTALYLAEQRQRAQGPGGFLQHTLTQEEQYVLGSVAAHQARLCAAMPKKMAEDVGKKIQALDTKMKSGQVSRDVTAQMIQWCQALDANNTAGAATIQTALTASVWDEHGLWLQATKRLVEQAKKC